MKGRKGDDDGRDLESAEWGFSVEFWECAEYAERKTDGELDEMGNLD